MKSIYSIPAHSRVSTEQLGAKPKFWFHRDTELWMFKQENRNTGEDWAEVVVADICSLLDIPHANYELAIDKHNPAGETRGVVTRNLRGSGEELIHGNTLLGALYGTYPEEQTYRVPEYTLEAVYQVIDLLQPYNQGFSHQTNYPVTAHEAFAHYLMLDALTGNQDRHHQNWGAIRNQYIDMLAPTYDHGAACARNLSDADREARMTTKDAGFSIQKFASRARSAFYSSSIDSRIGTHEAFSAYCERSRLDRGEIVDKLKHVTDEALLAILSEIPESRMTDICKQFTLQYLQANRKLLQAK